jgi:hypothetical protein
MKYLNRGQTAPTHVASQRGNVYRLQYLRHTLYQVRPFCFCLGNLQVAEVQPLRKKRTCPDVETILRQLLFEMLSLRYLVSKSSIWWWVSSWLKLTLKTLIREFIFIPSASVRDSMMRNHQDQKLRKYLVHKHAGFKSNWFLHCFDEVKNRAISFDLLILPICYVNFNPSFGRFGCGCWRCNWGWCY